MGLLRTNGHPHELAAFANHCHFAAIPRMDDALFRQSRTVDFFEDHCQTTEHRSHLA